MIFYHAAYTKSKMVDNLFKWIIAGFVVFIDIYIINFDNAK